MVSIPEDPPLPQTQALVALYHQGRLADVVAQGRRLARQYPRSINICNLLGAANAQLGETGHAVEWFSQAVAIAPSFADGHNNLGNALSALGRKEEAVKAYRHALALTPNHPEILTNLAHALHGSGRNPEALAACRQALALAPGQAEAHNALGNILQEMGELSAAADAYRRALRLAPGHADAHYNLGNVLSDLGQPEDAVASYAAALQARPGHALARAHKMHEEARLCDWPALAAQTAFVAELGISGEPVTPFALLSLEDDPERQLRRARNFVQSRYAAERVPLPSPPATMPSRLKIGYFSADFHDHATMHLLGGLLGAHDRAGFSVHVFSYGPPRDDAVRARLQGSVDAFHDVAALGDAAIAALGRQHALDIAVDLKGLTAAGRPGIFTHRPAPVQIGFLGYPGTLGMPILDYIIADQTLIPAEFQRFYAEAAICLPGSYQPNDRAMGMDAPAFTRTALGLPETGFVFCCFNSSWKIMPEEFDIWMRLLRAVEGSVLWLLESGKTASKNLRHEAQARGVDPSRLVFAERMEAARHMARQRHADLFLDTFHCNAHTTASDALWSGVPVLTKTGRSFAARVATSLVRAAGVPELAVATAADYERLALSLAQEPERLQSLRKRLEAGRTGAPLFDGAGFVRHLEAAYRRAYERWFRGLSPALIEIA
jgi:predicted O-linked N-acetylglucosamine transferase (SPINDLY family)